jgi:hypothetical protein
MHALRHVLHVACLGRILEYAIFNMGNIIPGFV